VGIQNPLKLIGFLPCHKWQGFLSNRGKEKDVEQKGEKIKAQKAPLLIKRGLFLDIVVQNKGGTNFGIR